MQRFVERQQSNVQQLICALLADMTCVTVLLRGSKGASLGRTGALSTS